jgi:uncharacterized protein (TIGR02145 family)
MKNGKYEVTNFYCFWHKLQTCAGLKLLVMSIAVLFLNSCKKELDLRTHDKGVVINGVKWAQRNVDKPGTFADRPEDPGMLYQWNSKVGWTFSNPPTPSDGITVLNTPREGYFAYEWEDINNVCPAGWRLPTSKEFKDLLIYSGVDTLYNYTAWASLNGIYGCVFRRDDNRVFLPDVGYRAGTYFSYYYSQGTYYWCSDNVFALFISKTSVRIDGYGLFGTEIRNSGFCVRCVAE